MGLFSRRPKPQDRPLGSAPPTDGLDAFADLLRAFGRHAFDLPDDSAESLKATTERWARTLLTGDGTLPVADVKLEFIRRRRAEQKYVPKTIGDLKRALLEAVGAVVRAAREDEAEHEWLEQNLATLARVIEDESPEELGRRVRETVSTISTKLEAGRAARQRRIDEIGIHVEHLQADLVDARKAGATDALTGLYNRGALDEDLRRLVSFADMTDQPLTALMVDIDHFKSVNDDYGHAAGDEVLRAVADQLVRAFPRKSDYIARYGGEEFTILLRDASIEDAERMADRLLRAMRSSSIDVDGQSIRVTASVGIAIHRPGEEGPAMIARADEALYRAKHAGRDRIERAR